MFNINNGRFADIRASGNWGGSTRLPVLFAGSGLIDVVFDHIVMPTQGQCFDLAFLKRVTFLNIKAVGAGDNGTGSSASPCIHIEYDATTANSYPNLVPFRTTDHVTVDSSVDISNFATALQIEAGSYYTISGKFYNNPGGGYAAVTSGAGIIINNQMAACCVSATDPVHDVNIFGAHISANGSGSGAGLVINAAARTGSEQIYNILVDGTTFAGNSATAISSTGPYIGAGTIMLGSNLLVGSNQTTGYDTTTLKLQAGQNWTPSDASGGGLTFSGVSASYNIIGNLVFARFSLTYPPTADSHPAVITGLPASAATANYGFDPELCVNSGGGPVVLGRVLAGYNNVAMYDAASLANLTNAQLSGSTVQCSFKYPLN